jgi:dTDP-4-amino-4,6-dideoxygalactose transaminase
MLDDGVATRRGVMNAHLEAAYAAGTWRAAGSLAHGEEAQATAVVLPLFHQMTDDDQARVVSSLTCALGG